MEKQRVRVRKMIVRLRRKLGGTNPAKMRVDNFSFEKMLDTVSNVTGKVSNVANRVANTTQTVRNIATNVRSELGQVRTMPPIQTSYVQPPQAQAQFSGFGLNINPVYIFAGIAVLIAVFIVARKQS